MKKVSDLILKLGGWKIDVPPEYRSDKAVVVMAPHTSMLDFWIGRLAYWSLGLKVHFLIKKELFFFPLGLIIKAMGGIPVNRKSSGNLTDQIVYLFSQSKHFVLIITPEGTRKLNYHWKRGFYYIATKANVPILLGYVDYKHKTGGIGKMFIPSGDFNSDLIQIHDFYKDITARYPQNFSLSPQNRNSQSEEPRTSPKL